MSVLRTPPNLDVYNTFVLPDVSSYSAKCLKKSEMVMRGRVEAAFSNQLIFITLTYDREHLPTTYKKVASLPLFSQRMTRKKFVFVPYTRADTPERPFIRYDGKLHKNPRFRTYKYKDVECRPLNLKKNLYRKKQIFNEQDFKNAKFRFSHDSGFTEKKHYGLLVPEHLQTFMELLRNWFRVEYSDKSLTLRYISNGEYGEHTHRPHYHIVLFDRVGVSEEKLFSAVRLLWPFGRIIQVKCVPKSCDDIKRLTAYIVGHTVKNDSGNRYQSELSPSFKLHCGGQGIGYQLLDDKLISSLDNSPESLFVRSLSFSLSNWDKVSPLKYSVFSDNKVFTFEFPRYYKDKVLGYLCKDVRQYFISQCRMIRSLIRSFCDFYNLIDTFDLTDVFLNIGLCANIFDILIIFMVSNRKKLLNFLAFQIDYSIFAKKFLDDLKKRDKIAFATYKARYSRRKQEKKYQDYLAKSGFIGVD